MPKSNNIIDLPASGELNIITEKELYKLPTEAMHNHLHAFSEKTIEGAKKLNSMSLVSTILCGIELLHIKDSLKNGNHGSQKKVTWQSWVNENCEFSKRTADKYIKVIKLARLGELKDVNPDLIPDIAPSLMSPDDLVEACNNLANALQGYGSRRQLYLDLEVIRTPQLPSASESDTPVNQSDNPTTTQDETATTGIEELERAREDATFVIREPIERLRKLFQTQRHDLIHPETAKELIDDLEFFKQELKKAL